MDLNAYLDRIGAEAPRAADDAALWYLHERHVRSVPFENLSIHLGEPVVLDEQSLLDKIVRRRRGGFCYELNGAFAVLLRELGFEVSLLAARVFDDEGGLGPPFDHLALRVEAEQPWLADIGFGKHALHPLPLETASPRNDPEGEFTVLDAPDGDLDVCRNGVPSYRMESRPRTLADFAPTCWWQATSPDSYFTRSLTCSLPTPNGRTTLSGNTLINTIDGERHERVLAEEEVLPAYREHFGIELDRIPPAP